MTGFTLHEAVSKAFDRTAQGLIFTKDLKTIYALLVICLNLEEKPKNRLNFLSRQWDFSFTQTDSVQAMKNLKLNVESTRFSTTVSYSIKPDLALSLLNTFFTAKLLHTPADCTRSEPKEKVLLQPTPKGVAIVQSYCKVNGIKDYSKVPIVNTAFNSLDLFLFERSAITGTIIYSEYFIHLLFARFVGPSPNIWSPTNPPDRIPSLEHRLRMDDEFDFSNFSNFVMPEVHDEPKKSSKKLRVSPFHHNFFTNPESDAHVQYYVSDKGVRLYHNYQLGGVKIPYCFNARTAWQWLMDCTDIMYPQEATSMLSLFCKYGLIEPIILPPSTAASKRNFTPKKTSFYTLSKKGRDISHWDGDQKTQLCATDGENITSGSDGLTLNNTLVLQDSASSEEENMVQRLDQLDIKRVLSDPGLRYLFRLHLEKEYCAENLDVYVDIRQFTKKVNILMRILKKPDDDEKRSPSKRAMVKLINECLSSAYNIYSGHISVGSPYQLNIDHMLREKITETMLHTKSPLRPRFDETLDSPEKAHLKSPEDHPLHNLNKATSPRGSMNNKKLSIEIPPIGDLELYNTPMTPTQEEMGRSLQMLERLFPLLEQVGEQILKMLEFDSFPKFLASPTLLRALE